VNLRVKISHYTYLCIGFTKAYFLLLRSILQKKCYFGPFVGEFGHLLSHIVPFISYLHSKGIKVYYCGPAIHKPFFYDNMGNLIVESYLELRDFYNEVLPNANDQNYPEDVELDILRFVKSAKSSHLAFWDIRNSRFYFNVFCKWEYFNSFVKIYSKRQSSFESSESNVVVFARNKGSYSPVRGDDWNFQELVDYIKDFVDRVYVLGHPAFSHDIQGNENVEVILTNDNSIIIEKCLKSKFIINQLSGTHYLGLYCNTRVILLLKGHIDYSNVNKDFKYRKKLGPNYDWSIVNSLESLKEIVSRN
jgi:hypothetical protein